MMRIRASARATREVSMVIHRRPPLFGHVGRSTTAARRIKDKIAGVSGH